MHNGYITVDSEKMSKSLGNFFTLKEIFKSYHPRVVRFFLLGTHYRSPIEYSIEMLEQARATLKGLDDFYLKHLDGSDESKGEVDPELMRTFSEKMQNDFDVAGALGVLYEWMKTATSNIQGTLERINLVFQIFPVGFQLTETQQELMASREAARAAKDWKASDALRDELAAQGIDVEDSKDGSFMKPKI
jgi:cysteinyl-tRNA synthetase